MLLTHHYNMADAAISRILGAPLATHYAVLGLSANTASASAVKSAFRKAALQVHPDKHPDRCDEASKATACVVLAQEVRGGRRRPPHRGLWRCPLILY